MNGRQQESALVMLGRLRTIAPRADRALGARARCHAAMARRIRAQARRQQVRRSLDAALVVAIPLVFLLALLRDLGVVRIYR